MSDYTKTTDFAAKDSLPGGDPGKIIKGSEFETEFDNIVTAIATKYDSAEVELAAIAGLTSAANKVPMFSGSGTATLLDFKDDDTMADDSTTAVCSQQSVKAYVDGNVGSSGTYTPTVTGLANVASISVYGVFTYSRVGNIITVFGNVLVDPTAGTAITTFAITLPVASNFTATTNVNGVAGNYGAWFRPGIVFADTVNDRMECDIYALSTTSDYVVISAQYIVQ